MTYRNVCSHAYTRYKLTRCDALRSLMLLFVMLRTFLPFMPNAVAAY